MLLHHAEGKCKIIINLMPMRKELANGHQTAKTDLLQVAFLCLKSVIGENVLRDRINAHFVMHIVSVASS